MYGGSTGAACAMTMTLGTLSLSWAKAPLADTIIAAATMAHAWLETACMIILVNDVAGGSESARVEAKSRHTGARPVPMVGIGPALRRKDREQRSHARPQMHGVGL
jgi:hypothetical protein